LAAQVADLVEQIAAQRDVLNLMQEHLAALRGLPEQVGQVAAIVEALAERQGATKRTPCAK
jgi:hypothetical protein